MTDPTQAPDDGADTSSATGGGPVTQTTTTDRADDPAGGSASGPDTAPAAPAPSIVDFSDMGQRFWDVLLRVAGVALAGAVVDGAMNGLTFVLLGRWLGLFVLASLLVMAVMTAVHAMRGADRAEKLGQRLSSDDVGISPRRIAGRGLLSAIEEQHAADAADADQDASEVDETAGSTGGVGDVGAGGEAGDPDAR